MNTAPDISVMVHTTERTEFQVSGMSIQIRGDAYPSVTVFFPDVATLDRLRDAITRRLDA